MLSAIIWLILLIISLYVLSKSSDVVANNSAELAQVFGISNFIIGLTIVAVGTSLPELAASISAMLANEPALVMGNVIGSNIANASLIVGLIALLTPLHFEKKRIIKEARIMLLVSLITFIFAFNRIISLLEGIILFCLAILYFKFVISEKRITVPVKKSVWEMVESLMKITMTMAAVFIVVFSANAVVVIAKILAKKLSLHMEVIGFILVALGTSLPEMSVSFSAAKKKMYDLVAGTIIGSNIANLTLITGLSAIIKPLTLSNAMLFVGFPFLLLSALIIYLLVHKEITLHRAGIALLLLYAISLAAFLKFELV